MPVILENDILVDFVRNCDDVEFAATDLDCWEFLVVEDSTGWIVRAVHDYGTRAVAKA